MVFSVQPPAKQESVEPQEMLQGMIDWPHWHEVWLTYLKEADGISFLEFTKAVRRGDTSEGAYQRAINASRMTEERFFICVKEFCRFMVLTHLFKNIGMYSQAVDEVWHNL